MVVVSKVTWRLHCVVVAADCVNIFKKGDFPVMLTQDELVGVAGDVILPPVMIPGS